MGTLRGHWRLALAHLRPRLLARAFAARVGSDRVAGDDCPHCTSLAVPVYSAVGLRSWKVSPVADSSRRSDPGSVTPRVVGHLLAIVVSSSWWTGALAQERRISDWRTVQTGGRRLTIGSEVRGRLTRRDPLSDLEPPLRLQAWEFEAAAGTEVSFLIFTTEFEPVLQVVGDFVDHDYGSTNGSLCNTRYTQSIERTGRHRLIVAGRDGRLGNGSYLLTMSGDPLEPPEIPCPYQDRLRRIRSPEDLTSDDARGRLLTMSGSTQRSELSNATPVDSADARWDVWRLRNTRGRPVRAQVVAWSAHFEPLLDIRGPGLTGVVADSSGLRDLRRCSAVLTVTLSQPGVYLLLVSAREPRALGSYSVTVFDASLARAPPPCPGS